MRASIVNKRACRMFHGPAHETAAADATQPFSRYTMDVLIYGSLRCYQRCVSILFYSYTHLDKTQSLGHQRKRPLSHLE